MLWNEPFCELIVVVVVIAVCWVILGLTFGVIFGCRMREVCV